MAGAAGGHRRPARPAALALLGARAARGGGEHELGGVVEGEAPEAVGEGRRHEPLARHGISMTRIESRPSRRRKWDYVFFVDVDGHAEESPLAEAIEEIRAESDLFRVLGAYPKAIV